MKRGLSFVPPAPVTRSDAARADVAVFVGRVARRAGALGAARLTALRDAGWIAGDAAAWTPLFGRSRADVDALLDLPVALAGVDDFDALFERARAASGPGSAFDAPLATAVRAFFAEGGRRAWVVRAGDPLPLDVAPDAAGLAALIPADVAAAERASWHGLAQVLGLPDAALLLLPDLAAWFAEPVAALAERPAEPPPWLPVFVECSEGDGALPAADASPRIAAPRVSEAGFTAWRAAVIAARSLLERLRPDMQLVTALPLPQAELAQGAHSAAADYAGFLQPLWADGLASERLQLAWPWLATALSARQPGGLEAPDARLAGRIAATVLARGAHRTAAGAAMTTLHTLTPKLAADTALAERVSVFGLTPTGIQLISDVSTADAPALRPASIRRVLGLVARAARTLGDAAVFEASGPALWRSLTLATEHLLDAFWRAGALNGASAADAYTVECGPATMSQADLDAGRVIVRVALAPAASVERIAVTLVLNDGNAGLAPGVLVEAA